MIDDKALLKWKKKMSAERLTPRTISFYTETIRAVDAIMTANGRATDPKTVGPEDVGWLLDHLAHEGYAVQTRKGYLSALRRWCRDGGNKSLNRWPKPRFPADERPRVDWLSAEQALKLLTLPKTVLQEAVVSLELRQGFRHVEVVRLRRQDVDWSEGLLTITGKGPIGGKPRIVPMTPETAEALRSWSETRDGWVRAGTERYPKSFADPEELIVWRKAGLLHPYSEEGYGLDKMVTLPLSRKLGFHVSNHTLRRTFGRALYRSGVEVAVIAKILGHESTDVTLRYIGVDVDDMRDAMNRRLFTW